ncbi:MAG TPA: ornithine cyclodeaminase family protein [Balneolaceae bacterium]|nr:ornithine cyclodeaminase family protein [Balneolaceae bacterium]
MKYYNDKTIFHHLTYDELIPVIRKAYQQGEAETSVAPRSFLSYDSGEGERKSTLLIMPAWQAGKFLGIKQVTLSPYNKKFPLPTLQGIYILFNAKTGSPLATFDASAITARRTAAKSAVAAQFLARQDASTLLMVGTGTLSPELIQAHCEVRPIEKVLIWEHTPGNGQKVVDKLSGMKQSFEIVSDIESAIPKADIISVATMSSDPLINGSWLKAGQHLDLVGAYRTDMREADNETLKRSDLYIDHEDAWHETGDLVIPLESGHLTKEDSKGTLFELCGNLKPGRNDEQQITCFKSTGHAMEDLASALHLYHKLKE